LEAAIRSLYMILAGEESPIVQNIGQDLDVVSHIYASLVMGKAEGRTSEEELAKCRREDEEWDDSCGHVIDELKANRVWPWKEEVVW